MLVLLASLPGCAGTRPSAAAPGQPQPAAVGPARVDPAALQAFIDDMATRHGFDREALRKLFAHVEARDSIVRAISTPAEAKPWSAYRPIFVNAKRIDGGVQFWNTNADLLERAYQIYGVPPQIIVAIIGVETRYGANMGRYPVIDALTTLAFAYPPRAEFFRSELEEYLLLAREEGLDPLAPQGSYAGAMGEGQFIPSSYRRYAIDFDGDGRRDLWNSPADAIGSVANYFQQHGWTRDARIATTARVFGGAWQSLPEQGLEPKLTIAQLRDYGIVAEQCVDNDRHASFVSLDGENGPEYWLGLDNFYVITRYNHSARYAMAVYQLSQAIAAQHHQMQVQR